MSRDILEVMTSVRNRVDNISMKSDLNSFINRLEVLPVELQNTRENWELAFELMLDYLQLNYKKAWYVQAYAKFIDKDEQEVVKLLNDYMATQ